MLTDTIHYSLFTINLKKELFHMDAYEYSELLKTLSAKMGNITNIVKPDRLQKRLDEIDTMQQDPHFWNDAEKAGKISQEKTRTERILATYHHANDAVYDAIEYFEMAKAEKDEETLEMLYEEAGLLNERTNALEVQMMLSGEHDGNNAIVSIHPGAGGTESQDWASMLYRMYRMPTDTSKWRTVSTDWYGSARSTPMPSVTPPSPPSWSLPK